MIVRLLKSYTTRHGKKLPIGQVFNRSRREAEQMINENIAEKYEGRFPPKKMKTDFFKPKDKWQQQA